MQDTIETPTAGQARRSAGYESVRTQGLRHRQRSRSAPPPPPPPPAYSKGDSYVPDLDPDYLFDRQTTLAILAGFAYNRRVMVTGYHGTGKSNPYRAGRRAPELALRAHQSRQPRLAYRSRRQGCHRPQGRQADHRIPATASCPGPISTMSALVFDEYDAGRPDVMFVIQRVLESSGRLTLLDQSLRDPPAPPAFRLFATANTIGAGRHLGACITARSRSTRRRWTAGRSSPI